MGGPSPHLLRRPTEADVVVAHSAVNNLKRLLQKREEAGAADDGLAAFAEEICTAVRKIKVVSWEAIHRERFPLTPLGIYGELCRNAQVLIERPRTPTGGLRDLLPRTSPKPKSPHRKNLKPHTLT